MQAPAPAPVASREQAPWPAAVDRSLPAPDGYHLVAARPDGRALVDVTGTVAVQAAVPGAPLGSLLGPGRGNTHYLAAFSLADGCIEATYDFSQVDRASSTGTVPEALAVLNAPSMRAEIMRAKALEDEFGPDAAPYAFSADGAHVAVEANDEIYLADTATLRFRFIAGGAGLAASVARRRVGFRRRINGVYTTAEVDFATGAVRTLGSSETHELYPEPDGNWIATTDDGVTLGRAPTRACIVRVDAARARETKLACFPSRGGSATISAGSPNGRLVALHVGEGTREERVVVVDTRTGQTVTEIAGHPIYLQVGDAGQVTWDDLERRKTAVIVGQGKTSNVVARDVVSVGFAADGQVILGVPRAERFAFDNQPLRTLADVPRCGHLKLARMPETSSMATPTSGGLP